MTTIIAGSKTIQDYNLIVSAIESAPWRPTTVFSGMRSGPDILGYRWAVTQKIPVRVFKPDWAKLEKPAGIINCFEMAAFAQALICITDGTDHVAEYQIKIARSCSCRLHIVTIARPQTTLADQGRKESHATQ